MLNPAISFKYLALISSIAMDLADYLIILNNEIKIGGFLWWEPTFRLYGLKVSVVVWAVTQPTTASEAHGVCPQS